MALLLQAELLHLFYPIFVHTYLQLVSLGAATVAHAVLSESKPRLLATAVSPRQRKAREAELQALLSLSTPEQLETSSLAGGLRAQRTPVRLSRYGYDLVLQYLRQTDMVLLLGIINQYLAVEVIEGAVPAAALDDGSLLAGVGGDADAGTINQNEIDLRLLQTSAVKIYETEIAEKEKEEAAKLAEDENVTKKEKQARQKTAAEAKDRLDKVAEKFTEAKIPLPPLEKEVQQVLVEHLRASKTAGAGGRPVSSDALPSAAFFTFVNARQTLNCVGVSSNASRVAAGFADSSLRIYNLDSPSAAGGAIGNDRTTSPTVLRGHAGPVYAADFSPDDQLLVSCSADGTARLWSTKLAVGLVAYQGHMLPVWDAAFAPDYGYYFATASADRTARVWVTERTQPLRVFAGHQSDVDVVRWHPNCHYIVTGSTDRTARLWDLRTGGCVRMLLGHNAPLTALAVAHDGVTLASADANGVISTWDLGSARQVATSSIHSGPVWSLDYSYGSGKLLASGGADCTVRLWSDIGSRGQLECEATWYTKATPVVATKFTKRNLLLAAGPLSLSKP